MEKEPNWCWYAMTLDGDWDAIHYWQVQKHISRPTVRAVDVYVLKIP